MSHYGTTEPARTDAPQGPSVGSRTTRSGRTESTDPSDGVYVPKVYAYVTRNRDELLVFEGPEHDGLQVPKGTVEFDESLPGALRREVAEESGLTATGGTAHLASDVWKRRDSPLRYYVRHFFHVPVRERRDQWTHTVTGDTAERGHDYEFEWVELPTDRRFSLGAEDHLEALWSRL